MKDKIVGYVKENPGASFAELLSAFPEMKGDQALCMARFPNVVLWPGLSEPGVAAMAALLQEKAIVARGTAVMTYAIDGLMPKMPVATRVFGYKSPRWLPVTFVAGDRVEQPARARKRR